jgi:uncharacterized protein
LQFDDAISNMQGVVKYKHRMVTRKLKRLTEIFPAVVVVGARQVGKSTLIQHTVASTADIVVFDPLIDVENARQDPELFFENHPSRPLVLDEIQYAPELLGPLKRRIDENRRPGQFIITGSQQWQVLRSLAESLAGRAVFLDLFGFSISEMAGEGDNDGWLSAWLESPTKAVDHGVTMLETRRTLYDMLWRGALPEADVLPADVIPDFFNAYLRTYVDRDVRIATDVSDWHSFDRFVRLTAALTAQEVNYSQLGRDIGLTPQTAHRWLDILEATFQFITVPAFSGNTVKRVSGKPKGYLADTGLACTLQRISTANGLASHPLVGALFETFAVQEIIKQNAALSAPAAIYHWRSSGGAEVDVILERDGRLFPIEVKLSSAPSRKDTSGLAAFRKTYPGLSIAEGLVLAPASAFRKISDYDYVMPWNARL